MKTNSEQIDKQLEAIKKRLIKSDDFVDLSSIRRLFRPNLSEKVAKDRLLKLRDSESEFYLLENGKLGYKLINRNIDWTLFKFLSEKRSVQKKPVLKTSLYDKGMANNINNLHWGMAQKVYVEIVNYTAVSAGKNSDYVVFPLKMVLGDTPFILAYDKVAKKVKQFNIGRMGRVELTGERTNIDPSTLLRKEIIDDFGFTAEKGKLWEVELLLTNYAMTMFIRDFFHLGDMMKTVKGKVNPEIVNGEPFYYQYSIKLKIGSMRVIGRLITGILAHVKVKNAPDEFRTALKEYIHKIVTNAILINI
jgi:hypothetical protein